MKVKNIKGQLSLPLYPTAMVRVKDLRRWQEWVGSRMPPIFSVMPIKHATRGWVHPAPYLDRIRQIVSQIKDPSAGHFVHLAFRLAWEGHSGQFRKSGEPYIEHPLAVAEIVTEWGMGPEKIAAALCHDLIEDGKIRGQRITKEYLAEKLGANVAELVEGITELGKEPEFSGEKPSLVDIYRKWLQYGAKDLAIIVAKLADRLHNMRTLAYVKEDVRLKKSEETLSVYAKIADILGIWEVKRELEDRSFQYVNPGIYSNNRSRRKSIIERSKDRVEEIVRALREKLDQSGLHIEIIPEKRFIFELHERMQKREILLEDLTPTDVWRIKIVVPRKEDCHAIEGRIHDELFPPVQGEIHNYIAEPRPNGHRFLHSYVKVPRFGRLLIQIRDQEMEKNYRLGILSRDWRKESFSWLSALMDYLRGSAVTTHALHDMIAAVSDPIVVYTRQGKAIELPFGSTALDFAAFIHTEIFKHAKEAIVNGRPAALSRVLQEGDEVFIVKDESGWPKLEWVKWIRTHKALQTLRPLLKKKSDTEEKSDKEILGPAWTLLTEEASRFHLTAEQLTQNEYFISFLREKGFGDVQDFIYRAGLGRAKMDELVAEFMESVQEAASERSEKPREYRVKIIVKDRSGLLDDITNPLKGLGVNMSEGFFYNYVEGEEKKGVIFLIVEGSAGAVGMIQQLQVLTIIKNTRGVEQVTFPSQEEIDKVMKEYLKGKG